jgi:hypothetical protein
MGKDVPRGEEKMAPPQPRRYTADEVASMGDEIYESQIRAQVEADNRGKVVAIDVKSGEYVVDETALGGCKRLLAERPDAEIWCVRVGHRALYHIGARSLRRRASGDRGARASSAFLCTQPFLVPG